MFPHIKVELRAEDKFFGPGVCELLELIEQTGSCLLYTSMWIRRTARARP